MPNKSSWYTYILQCSDDTLYTGVTTDTERRLDEHNNNDKLAAKYTRVRRPVVLIHQEKFKTRSLACKREAAIKKLSRKEKNLLLT